MITFAEMSVVIHAHFVTFVLLLVYTSTVNVVYAGQEILDGRELSLPYLDLGQHTDHYSKTKQIAEEMVLTANAHINENGNLLHTTALR